MNKLSFFTDPYEKELIYSAIARYNWYTGMIFWHSIQNIYMHEITLSFEFINGTRKFIERLGSHYTIEDIIDKHTNINFYMPFLKKKCQERIKEEIRTDNRISLKFVLSMDSMYNMENRTLKYCKHCVEEDYKNLGEPYFHREHQLPGVLVCQKHENFLDDYGEYKILDTNKELIRLEYGKCSFKKDNNKKISSHWREKLLLYSRYAEQVLEGKLRGFDQKTISEKYKQLLIRKSLASVTGTIKQKELFNSFVEYYGEDFLHMLGCGTEAKEYRRNWFNKIARGDNKISNPIKHILFIIFLEPDINKFFQAMQNNLSLIETRPAICINKFCQYYLEDVIEDINIINSYNRKYNTQYPFKLYCCQYCGMQYSIRLDDLDQKKVIRSYGHEWEKSLQKQLAGNILSINEIAEFMGCEQAVVLKYKKQLDKKEIGSYFPIQSNVLNESIESQKEILIRMIKENPTITRAQMCSINRSAYRKVKDVDPMWMETILPSKIHKNHGVKTDWKKLDSQILEKMKGIYHTCMNRQRPLRVTATYICKELEISKVRLYSKFKNIPESNKFFYSILESAQEFKLRRCKIAIDNISLSKKNITLQDVCVEAGIRIDVLKDIEDKIIDYIKELQKV